MWTKCLTTLTKLPSAQACGRIQSLRFPKSAALLVSLNFKAPHRTATTTTTIAACKATPTPFMRLSQWRSSYDSSEAPRKSLTTPTAAAARAPSPRRPRRGTSPSTSAPSRPGCASPVKRRWSPAWMRPRSACRSRPARCRTCWCGGRRCWRRRYTSNENDSDKEDITGKTTTMTTTTASARVRVSAPPAMRAVSSRHEAPPQCSHRRFTLWEHSPSALIKRLRTCCRWPHRWPRKSRRWRRISSLPRRKHTQRERPLRILCTLHLHRRSGPRIVPASTFYHSLNRQIKLLLLRAPQAGRVTRRRLD